jgi:hypothetical protein
MHVSNVMTVTDNAGPTGYKRERWEMACRADRGSAGYFKLIARWGQREHGNKKNLLLTVNPVLRIIHIGGLTQ